MNDIFFFKGLAFLCATVFLICVIAKVFYFIKAGKTGPLKFTVSFFKRYNLYQIVNAPELVQHYMKVSNRLNTITWLSGIIATASWMLLKKLAER